MATHAFTLLLSGPDPTEPDVFASLEAGGCNDALFGVRGGVAFADFDREAATLGDAVLGAIHDIESSVPALNVLRVEPEELVTASAIASRIGRTRESVRLWIEGRTRLWRWAEVSQWLSATLNQTPSTDSATLAAINAWLELRRYGGVLAHARLRRQFANLIREQLDRLSA